MNINEYQQLTLNADIYPENKGIDCCVLGMVSKVGKISNKLNEIWQEDKGIISDEKAQELVSELSDVMMHCSLLSHKLGYDLSDVAKMNIKKNINRKLIEIS